MFKQKQALERRSASWKVNHKQSLEICRKGIQKLFKVMNRENRTWLEAAAALTLKKNDQKVIYVNISIYT